MLEPTDEEIFEGIYCLCGHSIPEEHEFGKCFYLDESTLVVWACKCKQIRPIPFNIKVEIYANVPTSTTEARAA